MGLRVTPLTGTIGGAVEGIELDKPIDPATFKQLHKAFLEHCVLVFRDQGIGPAAQTAFGKLWGEPAQQGNVLLKDLFVTPEIIKVTKIPKETASTEANLVMIRVGSNRKSRPSAGLLRPSPISAVTLPPAYDPQI